MNPYKYLPFEKYILISQLSAEEVRKRLADNIESQKKFSLSPFEKYRAKPYEGSISEKEFTIKRIINYRNSFLPVIKGQIREEMGQVSIQVYMRPATGVLIFLSFWFGIVILACLTITVVAILQFRQMLETGINPGAIIPFGMFVFGSLLITLGFKSESGQSKDFLKRLLKGQEVERNRK